MKDKHNRPGQLAFTWFPIHRTRFVVTFEDTVLSLLNLTYLLTPCSRVLLEKITGFQLVKKFPAFFGTLSYITAFTSDRQLSLSWASSIQSMTSHPTSWISILIVSSHLRLGLPSVSFPQVSPPKPYISFPSTPCVLHAHRPTYPTKIKKATKSRMSVKGAVLYFPPTQKSTEK